MCGITGWIDYKHDLSSEQKVLDLMVETLARRGPDARGTWHSTHAALGHRRLCVVDPSGGGQPMIFRREKESYILVYNGELYNTDELRSELVKRDYHFQSSSDTEVLLKAYAEWQEECLPRLNGIFAFAVWDEYRQRLFLARDRLGVKPLFYAFRGSSFIFGSELKALLAHPLIEPVVDAQGLAEIFVMGPSRTPGFGVFKDTAELKPGHYMAVELIKTVHGRYWALESKPHPDSLETTACRVRHLVRDSLQRQLVSDVPLAAFLSGGLDSTILTAYAAKSYAENGSEPLRTYSVDYEDNALFFKENEYQPDSDAPLVWEVSKKLKTNHRRIIIKSGDLARSLAEAVYTRDLPGMADIDSSLYLFCKAVKKQITVVLSGECADEIFGGYPWFSAADRGAIDGTPGFPWIRAVSKRMQLLSPGLVEAIQPDHYLAERYREALTEVPRLPGEQPAEARMRELFYLNITRFMPTLLDRKDRMSMAVGLEARVPFCDHRLVEYVWNIPWKMKRCGDVEKGILRLAMQGEIPADVINRKKSPYPVTHHPNYLEEVKQHLLSILNLSSSPLKELVNFNAVLEFTRSTAATTGYPWFGQLMGWPQLLAYLCQVDLWLRRYKVRLNF
ncbi:MAG: asparagine synthase (glutamine-hydrolyzing) [Bacillota bacterium]